MNQHVFQPALDEMGNDRIFGPARFSEYRRTHDIGVMTKGKSTQYASIAKHKLVYPVLALAPDVPSSLEIVPVYVHTYREKDGVHFRIAECHFPDPRLCTTSALTALQARRARHLVLPLHVVRSLS